MILEKISQNKKGKRGIIMRLKERTFFYKELKFHINDAKYNNEFTPKYLLMFWNDSFGYWQEQLHVGSKKEALAYIKECEKLHCRMFA